MRIGVNEISILEQFPTLTSLQRCDGIPDEPFDWNDPNPYILDEFWRIQERLQTNLNQFYEWTNALLVDLVNARNVAANQSSIDAIDCARFITCAAPIFLTQKSGQMGDCFDWIWIAISHTHQFRGDRNQENVVNFLVLENLSPDLSQRYLDTLPNFISAAFYISYKLGGLDRLTREIANDCWNTLALMRRQPLVPDDAFAVSQMLTWAAYQNWLQGQAWADSALERYAASHDPVERKILAMSFITPANTFVAETTQVWAQRILDDHLAELVEFEYLQILSVVIIDEQSWGIHKDAVLREIVAQRTIIQDNLMEGESFLEALEQRVQILNPLYYSLANFAQTNEFLDILSQWYGCDGVERCDNNVLIVMPTHNAGVAYIWPQGRLLTGTGDWTAHNEMQQAIGPAIGGYFRGTEGDQNPEGFQEFRFDMPSRDHSNAMEAAIMAHYNFPQLQRVLPEAWQPRSLVVFPSGPEPLQALLARETGILAPIEVSLEEAKPTQAITSIAVWLGEVNHGQFELDAIRHIADKEGWLVRVYGLEEQSVESFQQFYENTDSEVLWVISHGEHSPFTVDETYLNISSDARITLEELRRYVVPDDGRRLLVLNTCSSAAAQGRGGLGKIGIAQTLVSASQVVIGNLWPISFTTGLVFGATLAACLSSNQFNNAAMNAIRLLQNSDELRDELTQNYSENRELLIRLLRGTEQIEPLIDWGCPIAIT